jgi:hypothetical protein
MGNGGLLQLIENGVVPGTPNVDNVDALFQQHSLMFLSKSIQIDGISAGVMIRSHQLCSDIEAVNVRLTHVDVVVNIWLARWAERLLLFIHDMCLPHHPLCTSCTKYGTMSSISNCIKLCQR